MIVPVCHSRRELPDEPETFYCVHPQVYSAGRRVDGAICVACGYWREPAPSPVDEVDYRRAARTVPCRHLGGQVGERACPTCRSGGVRVKVFRCRHPQHGETTWRECLSCADYVPP